MQDQLILFIIRFVEVLRSMFFYLILGRILLSWLSMGQQQYKSQGGIQQFLVQSTDPIINIARKIPHRIGMLDMAPLIAMFAVDFLAFAIISGLQGLL